MNLNYVSITLAAGASYAIHQPGRVFACDSSTADFALRFDNQAEITASSKRVFGSSTSPAFSRVTLRNTSGSSNTIVFAISFQDIKIEQQIASIIATITVAASRNAATTNSGSGITALADAATATFTNTNRKQIIIRNRSSSAGTLQIQDGSGNIMDELAPGDPAWTVESSGTFIIKASGGSVSYIVGQVIYS